MFERRFRRDLGSLHSIVGFVAEFLATLGIAGEAGQHVHLVVEELFTNMVKHHPDGTEAIELAIGWEAPLLTLRLRDFDVDDFDVTRPPAEARRAALARGGGRGLELVQRIAERLDYAWADRVSTVTATMRLSIWFEIRAVAPGRVMLGGRLDAANAERARQVLDALTGSVTLDCAQLQYVSSAGLTELMRTHMRLVAAGHTLRLASPTPMVRKLLQVAGFDRVFPID